MSLMCLALRLSLSHSLQHSLYLRTWEKLPPWRQTRRERPESAQSQWACHWDNTPWLKETQLWLSLHAWCGPMMVHPWPGDETLMNCQEAGSFKWEISRKQLHIGNIIEPMSCLDITSQVVMTYTSPFNIQNNAIHRQRKYPDMLLVCPLHKHSNWTHNSVNVMIKRLEIHCVFI